MKSLFILLLSLSPLLQVFPQSVGDFTIPYKANATGPLTQKNWIGGNSKLWGTTSAGAPVSITIGSGLTLSSNTLTGSGSSAAFADITGAASDNASLAAALALKSPIANPVFTGPFSIRGASLQLPVINFSDSAAAGTLSLSVSSPASGQKTAFLTTPSGASDTIAYLTSNISGTSAGLSATLAVASGGTGATTLTANNVLLGNGTSAVQFVAPGTSGNVLTSNGTTWVSAAAGATLGANTFTAAQTITPSSASKPLTLTGGTVTTALPILDMTQTWNAPGVTFPGLKFNAVTGTGGPPVSVSTAATASKLLDLQADSNSVFSVGIGAINYAGRRSPVVQFGDTTWGTSLSVTYGGGTTITSTNGGLYINAGSTSDLFSAGSGVSTRAAGAFAWSSTTSAAGTADLFLRRIAAATLGLGTPLASAWVSQIIGPSGAIVGTTTNGAPSNDLTITNSVSTGTGESTGVIKLATYGTNGASGTAIGTLTERMRVSSSGVTIGSGGTPIAKHISATATLDFGDTAAGTVTDLTITVTGAASGDEVSIGVPAASVPASGSYFGWVSAADTVTIRFSNNALVTSYNPASGTFRASVNNH